MSIWVLPFILLSGVLLTSLSVMIQTANQAEWYRYHLSKSRLLARSGLAMTNWQDTPLQPIVTTTNVQAIRLMATRIPAPVDGEIWIVHTATQRLSIGITTGAISILYQSPSGDVQIREFI